MLATSFQLIWTAVACRMADFYWTAFSLSRGHLGTYRAALEFQRGARNGRAGTWAQIGEGEAGAARQYKESAGSEEEGTAAMAERTGVADHRATGVAVVGGE